MKLAVATSSGKSYVCKLCRSDKRLRINAAVAQVGLDSSSCSSASQPLSGLAALDKQEFQKAAELFAKAVEANEPDGAFYLGRMLELGMMVQANPAAAIEAYRQSATKGGPQAKNRLGMLHLEGAGVLRDYEEGAKLVCESADASDSNGQFNCGLLALEGRGIPKDPKRGISLLEKAVVQNHIGAKNILGQAYLSGNGVDKNEKRGIDMFQQTAASGNPVGLFALAQAYTLGAGLDKDLVKAHAYFNLAAARKHPEAIRARQMIEQQLKPEQVQEAQRFARAWQPAGGPSVADRVKSSDQPARSAPAAPSNPRAKKLSLAATYRSDCTQVTRGPLATCKPTVTPQRFFPGGRARRLRWHAYSVSENRRTTNGRTVPTRTG